MTEKTKIFLGTILLLIAIQLIFQGINQLSFIIKMNFFLLIGGGYWLAILFGIFFIFASIFVFLKKSWIKKPLFILSIIFLIYLLFSLSAIFDLYQGGFFETYGGSVGTALFFAIDYFILTVISIILIRKIA